MAKSTSLEEFEIALIKTMINRGMQHASIQFYFNRPDRFVNNGRISEIKKGDRGANVKPATEFEVDEFINSHELTRRENPLLDPKMPDQNRTMSVFTVTDEGKIDVVPDPAESFFVDDPNLEEIYKELKHKVHVLCELGHNSLGEIQNDVLRFSESLPPNPKSLSIAVLWSRGNALRSLIKAHEHANQSLDPHPAKLDPACAARLADTVELFNVLITLIPKGQELDRLRLGPAERKESTQALSDIAKAVGDVGNVSTPAARAQIQEQFEAGIKSAPDAAGEKAVANAVGTTQNVFITAIKSLFFKARLLLKADLMEVIKRGRRTALEGAIKGVWEQARPLLYLYLLSYIPEISAFLQRTLPKETWTTIADLIKIMF